MRRIKPQSLHFYRLYMFFFLWKLPPPGCAGDYVIHIHTFHASHPSLLGSKFVSRFRLLTLRMNLWNIFFCMGQSCLMTSSVQVSTPSAWANRGPAGLKLWCPARLGATWTGGPPEQRQTEGSAVVYWRSTCMNSSDEALKGHGKTGFLVVLSGWLKWLTCSSVSKKVQYLRACWSRSHALYDLPLQNLIRQGTG